MALDAFAASLTVGFALYLLRTFLPPTVTSATPLFATRNWLRTSIPMLVNSELTIALKRIDIILVGAIIGTTEAGIYAIASKIAQLVSFGLKSSNVMAAPLFAGYHTRGDQQSMQSTASIAAGFASVWCILVGGGLIVFKNLTMQLFGDQFVAGTSVLVILCVGKIGAAITGPVGVILDATGNQDINVKITVVIILCNIFLSARRDLFHRHKWCCNGYGNINRFQKLLVLVGGSPTVGRQYLHFFFQAKFPDLKRVRLNQ